jgi:hypothetical protein
MKAYTTVGDVAVPLKNAHYASIVTFRGGAHGKKERGDFCFWTAVLKRPYNGKRKLIGRAYAFLDPGDRFDRMQYEMMIAATPEDRAAYREMWEHRLKGGNNIDYIRPSTKREIERWLKTHRADANYVERFAQIGGTGVFLTSWF